jgi:WD40 repeat protein
MVRNEPFPVAADQYSTNGSFGVLDGDGSTLFRLWNEFDSSQSCAPPASPPDAAVAGFAVSQDTRTLAMVDAAGVVQLRAVDSSGEVAAPWAVVETGIAANEQNISIAVANGASRVAVQGRVPTTSDPSLTSRLVVADIAGAALTIVRDVPRMNGPLAISPNGTWVAFQDGDYTTDSSSVVLDGSSGVPVVSVTAGQIDSFSPDSQQLAVVAGGAVHVWDLASRVQATTYAIPGAAIAWAALSPNWALLGGLVSPVPYSSDGIVAEVWHPQDGSVVHQIGQQRDLQSPPRFDTSSAYVAALTFNAHTIGTNWSAWHVWSVADGTEIRAFPLTAATASTEPFAFLIGGRRILTRAGTAIAVWCR